MVEQFLSIIRDFQTLIVGTFGFIGVIFTMYKNSEITREQRESIRNHDKQAYRSAIYSELSTIKDIFKMRSDDVKNKEGTGILLPDSVPTSVFDSLQSQLGILEVEEISQIIKSYLLIKELPIRLKVLSVDSGSSNIYDGYIFINSNYVKTAGEMHENFIITIDKALNTIKL